MDLLLLQTNTIYSSHVAQVLVLAALCRGTLMAFKDSKMDYMDIHKEDLAFQNLASFHLPKKDSYSFIIGLVSPLIHLVLVVHYLNLIVVLTCCYNFHDNFIPTIRVVKHAHASYLLIF